MHKIHSYCLIELINLDYDIIFGGNMNRIEIEELIKNRIDNSIVNLSKASIDSNTDLSNLDMHNFDFTDAIGENINFSNSNLSNSNFTRCRFHHSNFTNTNFQRANLEAADIRYSNFINTDFRGTIFKMTFMEKSIHKNVLIDENTLNYKMTCPEKGPFVCYKKCYDNLIVQLLVPADARRSSDTSRMCRCDKAKVLNITNFDHTEKFTEARSLCGRDFYYHVGEFVYEPLYNDDRWLQSTYGIHFFMTEDEAKNY